MLAARGNPAEALQAYEEIRALLMDELGTVPGSELMALHAGLLKGEMPPTAEVPHGAGGVRPSTSPVDSAAPGR